MPLYSGLLEGVFVNDVQNRPVGSWIVGHGISGCLTQGLVRQLNIMKPITYNPDELADAATWTAKDCQ